MALSIRLQIRLEGVKERVLFGEDLLEMSDEHLLPLLLLSLQFELQFLVLEYSLLDQEFLLQFLGVFLQGLDFTLRNCLFFLVLLLERLPQLPQFLHLLLQFLVFDQSQLMTYVFFSFLQLLLVLTEFVLEAQNVFLQELDLEGLLDGLGPQTFQFNILFLPQLLQLLLKKGVLRTRFLIPPILFFDYFPQFLALFFLLQFFGESCILLLQDLQSLLLGLNHLLQLENFLGLELALSGLFLNLEEVLLEELLFLRLAPHLLLLYCEAEL